MMRAMALSDDELFDFDTAGLAIDSARLSRALAQQGNVYRAQLVAARWFEGWRLQIRERGAGERSPDYLEGFDEALATVVAHLRQGDLIPGGPLYEDEVGGGLAR